MRFGYWLPVFGGWLRNVADEGMDASWDYARRLAKRSEEIGYDLTLIAELTMNDIKAVGAPTLDAWSTAAALAAVTERLELMVAVRPTFHHPAAFAKQAANIDQISKGRLALNVVSAWWADEARRHGLAFDTHDDRYERTRDWLAVVDGLWRESVFTHRGSHYRVEDAIVSPKPLAKPRPTIYAGGESEAAKEMIASLCDAYVMHGDSIERIQARIEDMRARRDRLGLSPLQFGMAAYAIVRDSEDDANAELARITNVRSSAAGYENYQQWLGNTQQDAAPSLAEYSVSNRGLRPNLVGTPEQIRERLEEFEAVGVDLILLQCSPQAEEMERFAAQVIRAGAASHAIASRKRRVSPSMGALSTDQKPK